MTGNLDWLGIQARINPEAPALLTRNGAVSFKELSISTGIISANLARLGVTRKSRVAVYTVASPDIAIIFHSLLRFGITAVPLNIRLTPGELISQIRFSGCTHVIVPDKSSAKLLSSGTAEVVPLSNVLSLNEAGKQPEEKKRRSDTALIMFTSGTSGEPRAVELSYGNFLYSAIGSFLRLSITGKDSWMLSLPMYHIGGYSILTRCLIYGIPAALTESLDTTGIESALSDFDPTIVSLVPTMLSRLVRNRIMPNRSHRILLLGGGPIHNSLIRDARSMGWKTVPTYGATETCSQAATAHPGAEPENAGGEPLPFVQISIVDNAGRPLPRGDSGEIVISGPIVSKGYLNNDDLNSNRFSGDSFRSGDLGYLDEGGRLHVASRRTDLIISGGENIDPYEVETVLRNHPMLDDVCVFPLEDEEWGQSVGAAVMLRNDAGYSHEEATQLLDSYAREHLASYKIPSRYFLLDSFPYLGSGKPDRRAIVMKCNSA